MSDFEREQLDLAFELGNAKLRVTRLGSESIELLDAETGRRWTVCAAMREGDVRLVYSRAQNEEPA
jgi:hypothetical protein